MKNRIWVSIFVLVILITNISCNSEIERNKVSSEKNTKNEIEDNSEKEDFAYTDEYFIKNYSIYRNPIDKYFLPKIHSWDASQVEYRKAQREYQKAWKAEFENIMRFMKKKCVYDEDKEDLNLLKKIVNQQVDIERKILKTYLTDGYEVDPDSTWAENNISRSSLVGKGTEDRLTQIEGELYRDVCMRILNLGGYEEYKFKFSGN